MADKQLKMEELAMVEDLSEIPTWLKDAEKSTQNLLILRKKGNFLHGGDRYIGVYFPDQNKEQIKSLIEGRYNLANNFYSRLFNISKLKIDDCSIEDYGDESSRLSSTLTLSNNSVLGDVDPIVGIPNTVLGSGSIHSAQNICDRKKEAEKDLRRLKTELENLSFKEINNLHYNPKIENGLEDFGNYQELEGHSIGNASPKPEGGMSTDLREVLLNLSKGVSQEFIVYKNDKDKLFAVLLEKDGGTRRKMIDESDNNDVRENIKTTLGKDRRLTSASVSNHIMRESNLELKNTYLECDTIYQGILNGKSLSLCVPRKAKVELEKSGISYFIEAPTTQAVGLNFLNSDKLKIREADIPYIS